MSTIRVSIAIALAHGLVGTAAHGEPTARISEPFGGAAVGGVRETQRTLADGARATRRVTRETLPAYEYHGKRVEKLGPGVHRRVAVDGPVRDGAFTRTHRELLIERPGGASPGALADTEYTPKWAARDVPRLYTDERLGPSFERDRVEVGLFAPRAKEVALVVDDTGERIPARPNASGAWRAVIERAPVTLYGKRYHFEVDGAAISDPYAHATDGDYGPSRFVDLEAYRWHDRGFRGVDARTLLIAEVHVRDMTASASAPVRDGLRGTYAGMAAPPIVAHYARLGAAVELLPVHEYDDRSGEIVGGVPSLNHWGYMSTHFFAPERRYAARASDAPHELQALVDAYHGRGVPVLMDVVYNHTANGGALHFQALGRDYYFRVDDAGRMHNGAGTGNELASERPMVRRLILDSLRHFVQHYHIDGFRFDLGALLDVDTMLAIDQALPPRIFLTSEPWSADWGRSKWQKSDLAGALATTRWSVWNDDFRNAATDYVVGNASGEAGANRLFTAIAGSSRPYGFTLRPTQTVNYVESHDELTIFDRVKGDRSRALMATGLTLMSAGIPMLGHGQEMLRSKKGIANTYNLDDDTNHIDWGLATKNADAVAVVEALVSLRRSAPQFALDRPWTGDDIKRIYPTNGNANCFGYHLPAPAPGPGVARSPDILVLSNAHATESARFPLPSDGEWPVVVHGPYVGARDATRKPAIGSYDVPPGTLVVLTRVTR